MAISTHFRTAPLAGRTEQSDYINGVWAIETRLSFARLKTVLGEIESECGRVRTKDTYASRPIDLDILICETYVDEDLFTRPFLAFPLLELAPKMVIKGRELHEICSEMSCPDQEEVILTEALCTILKRES